MSRVRRRRTGWPIFAALVSCRVPHFSNLSGYGYSTGLQTGNVFDESNRLTKTCVATTSPAYSAGTKLASYEYTLGPAGNRTNVLELNNRNVGYSYDNDYRLTSETIAADPAGRNGMVNY